MMRKERWKQTQYLIYFAALNFEAKDKNITPEKFFPLPWESEINVERIKPKKTKAEIAKAFEEIDKILNK